MNRITRMRKNFSVAPTKKIDKNNFDPLVLLPHQDPSYFVLL